MLKLFISLYVYGATIGLMFFIWEGYMGLKIYKDKRKTYCAILIGFAFFVLLLIWLLYSMII